LVGVQPVLMQVPPNDWRSMMATSWPAPASCFVSDGPACPAPMMTASYVSMGAPSASASMARSMRTRYRRGINDTDRRFGAQQF
jgi:hypothetical protein